MSKKDMNLQEFCQELAKGLKDKVEEFGKNCLELRKAEAASLAKSGLEKVAPPGREDQVRALKDEGYPKDSAFKIAWWSYKNKKSKATKKNMGPSSYGLNDAAQSGLTSGPAGMGGMQMSETNLKEFPKLDDPHNGYHDVNDPHPSTTPKHTGPSAFEPTVQGKKLPPTKKTELKLGEEYIDGRHQNDHDKRLKSFGGKQGTVTPKDKASQKVAKDNGSGGEVKGGSLGKAESPKHKAGPALGERIGKLLDRVGAQMDAKTTKKPAGAPNLHGPAANKDNAAHTKNTSFTEPPAGLVGQQGKKKFGKAEMGKCPMCKSAEHSGACK